MFQATAGRVTVGLVVVVVVPWRFLWCTRWPLFGYSSFRRPYTGSRRRSGHSATHAGGSNTSFQCSHSLEECDGSALDCGRTREAAAVLEEQSCVVGG